MRRRMITNLAGKKELVNLPEPFYFDEEARPAWDYSEESVCALFLGPRSRRMFASFHSYRDGNGWRTEEVDLPTFFKYCDRVGIDAPDSIEAVEV